MKTIKELEEKLNKLTEVVMTLVEKLPTKLVEAAPKPMTIERLLRGQSDPVPSNYRLAVDEILNKKFNIHVKASADVPTFKFTIIVPADYTKQPFDLRPKVITYAEGLLGVKEWCERVFKTFDEQVRQRITADRGVYNPSFNRQTIGVI